MLTALTGTYAAAGLLSVHAWALARRRWPMLVTVLGLDLITGGLAAVAVLDPERFHAWMQEDAWAEWATFFAFLGTAAVSTWHLVKRLRSVDLASTAAVRWLSAGALAAVALFGLFVAGEEISWGQRLFAFRPPEVFLESNFQQELNAHNFLKGKEVASFKLDSRYLVVWVALAYGWVLPALTWWLRRRSLGQALSTITPAAAHTPWFALVACAELAYPVSLTGEACEFVLGVAFLSVAIHRGWSGLDPLTSAPPRIPHTLRPAFLAVPLLLGVASPPTVQALFYGSDGELRQQAIRELKLLVGDLSGDRALRRSFLRKSRVHKRLFTATRRGYLRFGTSSAFLERQTTPAEAPTGTRRDRRGYFLDPWNNPYWIAYNRRHQRILIYSFGPNRKRDMESDAPRTAALGDDIVVRFSVTRRSD